MSLMITQGGGDDELDRIYKEAKAGATEANKLRQGLAVGVPQNPDSAARRQRVARALDAAPSYVEIDPDRAEAQARLKNFDYDHFSSTYPVTTRLMADPDNAAAGHDDLETYKKIEEKIQEAMSYGKLDQLTPAQRQATLEHLMQVEQYNAQRNEASTVAAHTNVGATGLGRFGYELAGEAVGLGTALFQSLGDVLWNYNEGKNILESWKSNFTHALDQGTVAAKIRGVGNQFVEQQMAGAKQPMQEYLTDPTTQQQFKNPLYAWWGRPLASTVSAMPGQLADMVAGGEFTAPIMALQGGTERFNEVYAKTGSYLRAGVEGVGMGAANYALMTKMPQPLLTKTAVGTIAQQTGRGVALGTAMTYVDNALRQLHEQDGDLTKNAGKHLTSMILFENIHSVNTLIGYSQEAYSNYRFMQELGKAVENSRMLQRDPERFADHLDQLAKGAEVSMDARTFARYWQMAGAAPAERAAAMGSANFKEALETGTDMVVPVGKFLSATANTPHFAELAKDVRVSPGAPTAREADALSQNFADAITATEKELQKLGTKEVPHPDREKIFEDVKAQLLAVGGDTARAAEEGAKVFTNIAVNLAAKASAEGRVVSPLDIAKRLRIVNEKGQGAIDAETSRIQAEAKALYEGPDAEAAYAALPGTNGGSKLDVDIARRLDPNFKKDPTNTVGIHHKFVSEFIDRLFTKRMQEPVKSDTEAVRFLAGGGGSGKGTVSGKFGLEEGSHTILDGTLKSYDSAKSKVDEALASGRRVVIDWIYRPVDQAVAGTIVRGHVDPAEKGRVVPLGPLAEAHEMSPKTVLQLMETYANDGRVIFNVHVNDGKPEDARTIPPDQARKFIEDHLATRGPVANTVLETYNQIREKGYEHQGERHPISTQARDVLDASARHLEQATRASVDARGAERPGGGGPDGTQDGASGQGPVDLNAPTVRLEQPMSEGSAREQIRSVRAVIQRESPKTYDEFKRILREQQGADYNKTLRTFQFGELRGDKALRAVFDMAKRPEMPGAPATVRTPEDRQALLDRMVEMAKVGESGRMWYDDSAKAFLDMAGGDRLKAFKLATLTALYSPQTSVADNGRRAILTYYDAMQNKAVSAGGVHPNVKGLAQRVMEAKTMEDVAAVMSGQKTSAFQQNLINLFSPEHANDDSATIDLHMMRAFGYDNEAPGPAQYKWAEQLTRDVANVLGWGSPKEAQAAIWVAQKMKTDNAGKGSDARQAGFHYGDAARSIAGSINVEATPGEGLQKTIFPGFANATREQLTQYHTEKMDIVRQALKDAGILVAGESTGHGYWEGKSNPVTAFLIPLPHIGSAADHELSPSAVAEVNRAARVAMEVLGDQDAVGWVRPFAVGKVSQDNGLHFALDRELTHDEMVKLGQEFAAAGLPAFVDASDAKNIKVVNYDWPSVVSSAAGQESTSAAKAYHKQTIDLILKALPADVVAEADTFHAQTDLVRKGAQDGNFETSTGPLAEGASAVQSAAVARGRAAVEALNERYRTEHGWGDGGEPSRGGGDLPRFQYREGGPHRVEAHGVHYSPVEGLSELDPTFSGKGAMGAERKRLAELAPDDPLRQRVYFYAAQDGVTPKPEGVVRGRNTYEAQLTNLYPLESDPAGFRANATDANSMEREIVAAGYDGYLSPSPGEHGAVVLLGTDKVAVQPHAQRLAQPDMGNGPRGYIDIGEHGQYTITITPNQNKSTFFHEIGHFYLETVQALAGKEGVGEDVVKLNADIQKWLGVQPGERPTVEQHEKFADAFLLYLEEGKAPVPELRSTFQQVARWFTRIGEKLISANVQLTPEVRDIFTRLVASDQQVRAASMEMSGTRPMFATAADMGVTQKEFDAYVAAKGKEIESAHAKVMADLMADARAKRTEEYEARKEELRVQVAAEIDATPEYKALKALTTGAMEDGTPVKLSRDAIVERYGEARLKDLARTRTYVYSKTEGMDPETAALTLGFESGDKLMDALTHLENRSTKIKNEVESRLRSEFGDKLTDGSLHLDALEALHNEHREDVLAAELRALNRLKRQVEPVVRDAVRDAAASDEMARKEAADAIPNLKAARLAAGAFVGNTPVYRTDPYKYLLAQRSAAKEAFDLQGKGDYAGAAEAKRTELLNHFMFTEAVKAQAAAEKTYKFARSFERSGVQEKIGKAGRDYVEQIEGLLTRFEFKRETNVNLSDREGLAKWVDKQLANDEEAVVSDWLLNEVQRKNYRQLTNNELEDVHNALKNIKHLAYRKLEMDLGDKRVAFDTLIANMDASARANNKTTPLPLPDSTLSTKQKFAGWLQGKDAGLLKMEQLINWLDGGDVNGPWHEAVWNPISRAQAADYDLITSTNTKLIEALAKMPEKQQNSMLDTFQIPGIAEPLNRKQIMTALFNFGTKANKEKLIGGYADKGFTEETMLAAFKNLKREDAQFVQDTWNIIGELWPRVAELQQRMSGVEPKREEPVPFTITLADGSTMNLDGGYFPLVAAKGRSTVAGKQESSATALFDYGGGYTKATTSTGHTKERTGAIYPLSLDFVPTVTQHTTQVVKDLTHREAVINANRILTNPTIRKAVQETMGEAYTDQLMPWLRNVVNDRNGAASAGTAAWQAFATQSRANLIAATLGFKYSSMIVQLTDALRVVGPGEYRVPVDTFTHAFLDFIQHPKQLREMVHEMSGEMRHREENLDRDLRQGWQQLEGDTSWRAEWNRKAFKGLGFMDALISVPAWMGAYRHALSKGAEHEQAVLEADRTVRLNLMSGNPKDQLAVQRDPDKFMKLVTMFMGDGPAQYNLLRNAGHKMDGLNGWAAFAGTAAMVSMANIVGDWLKGQGPAPNEDKKKWAARKAALAWTQPIPIVRDVASAVDGKLNGKPFSDYRLSPAVAVGQKVVDQMGHTQALIDGKEKVPDFALHSIDTLGHVFGIGGTAQFVASGKYLRRVQTGEERPKNAAELAYNTVAGKPKEGVR